MSTHQTITGLMTDKYKNKYRIKSHRRPNWDYDRAGAYFITICTQNRICNLGKIVNSTVASHGPEVQIMELSDFGKIVDTEWQKSFGIREELYCDEYIIMPNHLHAIIILNNDIVAQPQGHATPQISIEESQISEDNLQTSSDQSGSIEDLESSNKSHSLHRLPKSISSFIAGFKSAVNSKIDDCIDENQLDIPKYNRKNHFFQSNYHDHIIRDNQSFQRIKNYIISNPQNWDIDKFQ